MREIRRRIEEGKTGCNINGRDILIMIWGRFINWDPIGYVDERNLYIGYLINGGMGHFGLEDDFDIDVILPSIFNEDPNMTDTEAFINHWIIANGRSMYISNLAID